MDTLAAKRWLGRVWAAFHARQSRPFVLLYHAVGRGHGAIAPDSFRMQLECLLDRGEISSLSSLTDGSGKASVAAISFDDGYGCVHDEAMPIMRSMGVVGTVFVNTGMISVGKREASVAEAGHYPAQQFMNWRDIDDLISAGWTIGSHGVDHVDLTKVSTAEVDRQLKQSKEMIERTTGRPCQYFAYTWGRHSEAVRAAVERLGYEKAFAGNHGPVSNGSDIFALPRINIASDYSLDDFVAIVRGDWDYLGWVQRARNRH